MYKPDPSHYSTPKSKFDFTATIINSQDKLHTKYTLYYIIIMIYTEN